MEGRSVIWPTTIVTSIKIILLWDERSYSKMATHETRQLEKKLPGFCKVMPVPIEISKPVKDHNQQNSIFPLWEK
jgi:hypothetical protein